MWQNMWLEYLIKYLKKSDTKNGLFSSAAQ